MAAVRSNPPERLSRQVVERFQAMLADGEIGPGDRLPSERELAERYGVGRSSVREALRELEILGLVESRQGAGTYVRAASSRDLMAPFRSIVALSEAAVADVLAFRRMFEPEVAAMAARNADDDGRALLQRALRRFDRSLGDGQATTADLDFHEAVARCTRNPIVLGVQHALADLFGEVRGQLPGSSYEPDQVVPRGHQAVFGAIVAGDAEAARDEMARHLDAVQAAMTQEATTP